jgi:hypothetical protein
VYVLCLIPNYSWTCCSLSNSKNIWSFATIIFHVPDIVEVHWMQGTSLQGWCWSSQQ